MTKRRQPTPKTKTKPTREDMRQWRLRRARQYDKLAQKEREIAEEGVIVVVLLLLIVFVILLAFVAVAVGLAG